MIDLLKSIIVGREVKGQVDATWGSDQMIICENIQT